MGKLQGQIGKYISQINKMCHYRLRFRKQIDKTEQLSSTKNC